MGATNTLYFCLHAQQALDNALSAGTNPKMQMLETLGFTKAVMSPANRQGFEFEYNTPKARPSSTSNRKVTIYGKPKNCDTVQTTAIDVCAGVTAETCGLVDDELQVNNYRGIQLTFDRAVYRDCCETPDSRATSVVTEQVMWAAEQILKRENADLINAWIAGVDNYFDGTAATPGGVTEKALPLYSSTAPIVPQPGNLYIVRDEYNRLGYSSVRPIGVGGTTLGRWAFDTNIYAGDTSATGRDITKIPSPVIDAYIDYEVDDLIADGNSHLATWTPGNIQKLVWCDFSEQSPLRRSNGEITYTTITIPIGGMLETFDIVTYDASCDHNIDVTISRYSNPYILSSSFFTSSCGGQENLLSWDLTCADTTCANIQRPGNIIT